MKFSGALLAMKDFRQLQIWQRAHQFTLALYPATQQFPNEELYGLTSQIRRATVSIPSNIAEGCGRGSDPDFRRFLHHAMGSTCELEYHLLLSNDLGYLDIESYQRASKSVLRIKRMLSAFISRLTSLPSRQPRRSRADSQ